jgi:hypothetical protein
MIVKRGDEQADFVMARPTVADEAPARRDGGLRRSPRLIRVRRAIAVYSHGPVLLGAAV